MMNKALLPNLKLWHFLVGLLFLAYLLAVPYQRGNDINVYLHASEQLFEHQNIYQNNPFNFYLYSPLFTILIAPLTVFDYALARVIWAVFNFALFARLFVLLRKQTDNPLGIGGKYRYWWTGLIIFLTFGFLHHNMILGQVTVLILWLTIEGLWQIRQQKKWKGAALLALGINIKIIPIITLGYLFLKGEFRSIGLVIGMVILSLWLPALIIGFEYNNNLLLTWKEVINPQGEKFAFENNDGCHSLNSIIPAYFYDFGVNQPQYDGYPRKIADIPYHQLSLILQLSRIILILSVVGIVFYRYQKRRLHEKYFFWEVSYLMLVSYLIFPHQMKYSMLYIAPTVAYFLYIAFLTIKYKLKLTALETTLGIFTLSLIFALTFANRDVIGDYLMDLLDYYRFMGISVLIFLPLLLFFNPYKLNSKFEAGQKKKYVMASG